MLNDEIEKRILIIQKHSEQKITIKRMRIKIETTNKFYFWLKGEIENKNQFKKKDSRKKLNN